MSRTDIRRGSLPATVTAAVAGCRVHTGLVMDLPHRAGRDRIAQAGQFALDSAVAQLGFSRATRSTRFG